jgi:hypothetical protein
MCKKEFKGKKKLELDLKQIWGAGTFYPPQISETVKSTQQITMDDKRLHRELYIEQHKPN